MQINIIIESLLAKICHDLMNPLNTAQMAIENNETEYIKTSIEDLILKVEIFRTLFKNGSYNEDQYNVLLKYIKNNQLNFKINFKHENLAALLYVLSTKIIKKSYVYVEEQAIHLQTCFLNEDEINIIEKKYQEINSKNVLFYLSIKKIENQYNISMKNLGLNEWKIIIQNI